MSTLIPATLPPPPPRAGEREFVRALEEGLDDEYRIWRDVPIPGSAQQVDYLLLHPRRGLLCLTLRDWGPERFQASLPGLESQARPPLEEALARAQALVAVLESDPHLIFSSGRMAGRLRFSWSWGVLLSQIRREQLPSGGPDGDLEARRVICQDELGREGAMALADRLGTLFPTPPFGQISPTQLDRIRLRLFPGLALSGEASAPIRVLDVDQERAFRHPEGHQVILGEAGTGKTTLLLHAAARLAGRSPGELPARAPAKPVLFLCLNRALARHLDHQLHRLGVADRVHIGTFPAWCHRLITQHHLGLPGGEGADPGYADALAERVARGLEKQRIAPAQYAALLIDEGHGFPGAWLALALGFLDPLSDVLALAADTGQLPGGEQAALATFQGAGIRCRNRVFRLTENHRSHPDILDFALGRAPRPPGPAVELARHASLKEEAAWLAGRLLEAHQAGMPWRHMGALYGDWEREGKLINGVFRQAGIPMTWQDGIRFNDRQDTVKLLSMNGAQGLEFPLLALAGFPANPVGTPESGLWRMAMLRARDRLLLSGTIVP
ncbi:MAG: UvrD-helicase domain-containing protein [Pseudomonadota bacterium]